MTTPATTAGAVKAYIESRGFKVPVFRDRAPAKQALPFAVVQELIAMSIEPGGTNAREQVQVDLYQQKAKERYGLGDLLIAALDRARWDANKFVYGSRVLSAQRSLDAEGIVRHTIQLSLARTL